MQNPYSEDQLVEQPAITLLENMGWHHQNCLNEFQYRAENITGRKTKFEFILTERLRATLERLNPNATQDAITAAIEELTQSRAVMIPVVAIREIYTLLKDGVPVNVEDRTTLPLYYENRVPRLQLTTMI
ncbi:hypothetical protein F4212_03910 [Candidatus Poribacteria bacterium]|nr:hypothetical protein [Candidatus Poribacteria bacterium]